jgi:hypothetical protein
MHRDDAGMLERGDMFWNRHPDRWRRPVLRRPQFSPLWGELEGG